MDWAAVVADIIAGTGSVVLSAIATPFAQRRTEEARARTLARRELIAEGRALVVEARKRDWGPPDVYKDLRFSSVRRHPPAAVQIGYTVKPRTFHVSMDGGWQHNELADAIDELEKRWRLI